MNIKHGKLLFVAGVINALLGLFYLACGILEFVNALHTVANTITQTIGVQLSYLVFISALLITASGLLTILNNKSLRLINTRVITAVAALAWPLFLQITLFFTQFQLNIRLLTMILAALFYVIAVLIVKITNETSAKSVKFNPSAMIGQSGKRAKTVDLNAAINKGAGKVEQKNFAHTVENIASGLNTHKSSGFHLNRIFVGKRKSSNGGIFKGIYSGRKKRRSHLKFRR